MMQRFLTTLPDAKIVIPAIQKPYFSWILFYAVISSSFFNAIERLFGLSRSSSNCFSV
jgi:hypothetical protein